MNSSSQALLPVKGGETAATRRTDIKVMGSQPVQSNLCTLQLALLTAVKDRVTRQCPENQLFRTTEAKGCPAHSVRTRRHLPVHTASMFPLGTGHKVSKSVFYAQSTIAVISGRYTLCHYTGHPVVSISIVIKVAVVIDKRAALA